jgi:hypothetical protein
MARQERFDRDQASSDEQQFWAALGRAVPDPLFKMLRRGR